MLLGENLISRHLRILDAMSSSAASIVNIASLLFLTWFYFQIFDETHNIESCEIFGSKSILFLPYGLYYIFLELSNIMFRHLSRTIILNLQISIRFLFRKHFDENNIES